jgi:hypothetical protein
LTKQKMSRTIDEGIDGRLRLKRELNLGFNTKGVNGMALNHSPIRSTKGSDLFRAPARAGLGQTVSGWAAGLECRMSGAKV